MSPLAEVENSEKLHGGWGNEIELSYYAQALRRGNIHQEDEGWVLSLPYSPIMTSGALVIKRFFHDIDGNYLLGISSLRRMGPATLYGLEHINVLPKLGVRASFEQEPPVFNLSTGKEGGETTCKIWHEITLPSMKNSIFTARLRIAIAGLSLLPAELWGKVNDKGLVIVEKHHEDAYSHVCLLPGKLLETEGKQPGILYPSDKFSYHRISNEWFEISDEHGNNLYWEAIIRTKPVAIYFKD